MNRSQCLLNWSKMSGLVAAAIMSCQLGAITIEVDPVNGNDGNDGVTAPVRTLQAAWALIPAGGGHEMVLQPGVYSDPADKITTDHIVNGAPPTSYNIIRAETDGTAIIKQPMILSPTGNAGTPGASNTANPQAHSDTFSPQVVAAACAALERGAQEFNVVAINRDIFSTVCGVAAVVVYV